MRAIRLILITAAVLMLCAAAAAEEAPNLLRNADFESVDDHMQPDAWTPGAYRQLDDYSLLFADEDCAHGGTHSLCIMNYAPNDAYYLQTVHVKPESVYRLSGWIMAEDVSRAEGQLYDRGASLSIFPNLYVHTAAVHDGDWTYVEMYGETCEGQDTVTVALRLGGYSGDATGTAWFDDVSLTEVEDIPDSVIPLLWFDASLLYGGDPDADANDSDAVVWTYDADTERSGVKPFTPWFIVISGAYVFFSAALLAVYRKASAQADAMPDPAKARPRFLPWQIWLILAAGLIVRIMVALPVRGYAVDIGCNTSWGARMCEVGPAEFYLAEGNYDYPPGYMYVFGYGDLVSRLFGHTDAARVAMVKCFPILADLAIAALISWYAARQGKRRLSTLVCLLITFNPVLIINGAAWGQIDSVLALLLLLVVILAERHRWEAVFPIYMLAVLFKPQALMFGPLGLAAVITDLVSAFRQRADERRPFRLILFRMLFGLGGAVTLAISIVVPFSLRQPFGWLFKLYAGTMSSYPYATVNTANLYYLLNANWAKLTEPVHVLAPMILAAAAVFNHRLTYYGAVKTESRRWYILILADMVSLISAAMIVLCLQTSLLDTIAERIAMSHAADFDVMMEEMFRLQRTLPDLVPKLLLIPLFAGMLLHRMFAYLLPERRIMAFDPLTVAELGLMDLFIAGFAVIAVSGCTWEVIQIPSILFALAVGIPMWLHRHDAGDLALAGAVILLLLYVCSTKMHERYFFPGLVLLAMACMARKDRRLGVLFLMLTVTEFINTGIPLDNSLRLGSAYGHLNEDTRGLATVLSAVNLAAVFLAIRTARGLCVGEHFAPAFPVRQGGDPE